MWANNTPIEKCPKLQRTAFPLFLSHNASSSCQTVKVQNVTTGRPPESDVSCRKYAWKKDNSIWHVLQFQPVIYSIICFCRPWKMKNYICAENKQLTGMRRTQYLCPRSWRIKDADPKFPLVNDKLELIIKETPSSYDPYLCIPVTNFFLSETVKHNAPVSPNYPLHILLLRKTTNKRSNYVLDSPVTCCSFLSIIRSAFFRAM